MGGNLGHLLFLVSYWTLIFFVSPLPKNKIGLCHQANKYKLNKLRNIKISKNEEIKFLKNLNKIGYYVKYEAPQKKIKLVKSFQRHFRQKLINGKIDQEMLLIAEKLSKNK